MPIGNFYGFTLIVLILILGFLGFAVMRPFLSPIAWAGVLSILFYPLYDFLRRRLHFRSVASVATLLVILVLILGPFSYISFLLAQEISQMVDYLEAGKIASVLDVLKLPGIAWLVDRVKELLDMQEADIGKLLVQNLAAAGRQLLGQVGMGVRNVLGVALNFVFMSLTIFFFLRDGSQYLEHLRSYLPFPPEQRDRLERQVKDMVISTMYGGVVVAVVQGLLAGTTYYFLDVPSPVVWGIATSIMSFVPMLGAFSVWGPIVVYLFVKGAVVNAIILFIVGACVISVVDNVLRPIIVGERVKMPTVLIFFSVLGGIKLFGLIGLIMGPMSVALFISVFEIFRHFGERQHGAGARGEGGGGGS
ncbi:MAG: AI-2E family transporter [Nitrospirota bacterium]